MAEDRKFKYEDGKYINRVSGEAIPDDEPIIIFRARDKHALTILELYKMRVRDEHHKQAVQDCIEDFENYRNEFPQLVKEPGITHHIKLKSEE